MGIEMLTLIGGTITGIISRLIMERLNLKRMKLEAKLKTGELEQSGYQKARDASVSPRFALTRQIIALSIILSTVVLPIAAPIFSPLTVYYCDYAAGKSWIFGLFTSADSLDCVTGVGIMITPIHTQLALAVAGLYLGATVAVGRH